MTLDWVDKGHRRHPLQAMEKSHMWNIIRMIQDGRMKRPGCSGFSNAEWCLILKTEMLRRQRRGLE